MAKTNHEGMRNAAAPYLRPEEIVESVFWAQNRSGYATATQAIPGAIAVIGMAANYSNAYRVFVVTDQRILVLDSGPVNPELNATSKHYRLHGVVAELPRSTPLGAPSGLYHVINVKGEKLRVPRGYFKDIRKAESERPGSRPLISNSITNVHLALLPHLEASLEPHEPATIFAVSLKNPNRKSQLIGALVALRRTSVTISIEGSPLLTIPYEAITSIESHKSYLLLWGFNLTVQTSHGEQVFNIEQMRRDQCEKLVALLRQKGV